MGRLQATAKVYERKISKLGSTNLVSIRCFEVVYSTDRKKSQEKLGLDKCGDRGRDGKPDGYYSMWYMVKIFMPDRGLPRFEDLDKGDVIDFCGQLNEEVWENRDGEIRKAQVVTQADVKILKMSPRRGDRKEERQGASEEKSSGFADDDIPF